MAQSKIINRRQMWIEDETDAQLADWYQCYHYLIDSNPAWLAGLVAKDLRRSKTTTLPHHHRQTVQKAA